MATNQEGDRFSAIFRKFEAQATPASCEKATFSAPPKNRLRKKKEKNDAATMTDVNDDTFDDVSTDIVNAADRFCFAQQMQSKEYNDDEDDDDETVRSLNSDAILAESLKVDGPTAKTGSVNLTARVWPTSTAGPTSEVGPTSKGRHEPSKQEKTVSGVAPYCKAATSKTSGASVETGSAEMHISAYGSKESTKNKGQDLVLSYENVTQNEENLSQVEQCSSKDNDQKWLTDIKGNHEYDVRTKNTEKESLKEQQPSWNQMSADDNRCSDTFTSVNSFDDNVPSRNDVRENVSRHEEEEITLKENETHVHSEETVPLGLVKSKEINLMSDEMSSSSFKQKTLFQNKQSQIYSQPTKSGQGHAATEKEQIQSYSETQDPLDSYFWYFGDVDRQWSEDKLNSYINECGYYLLRKSQRGGDGNPYTISIVYKKIIYHLLIRKRSDEKFALGKEKPDEKVFATIPEFIAFYQNNVVELIGDPFKKTAAGKVALKNCPPK